MNVADVIELRARERNILRHAAERIEKEREERENMRRRVNELFLAIYLRQK